MDGRFPDSCMHRSHFRDARCPERRTRSSEEDHVLWVGMNTQTGLPRLAFARITRTNEPVLPPMSEQAERYKAQGNAALTARRFAEAAELYSSAIALEPSNATYFSNRAAAHAALEDWQASLDDSHEVVTLRPEWAKGWVRRGGAFMGLKKHEEARKAYLKASQLEPGNAQIQQLLEGAEAAVAKAKERRWEDDLWSDDDDEGGAGAAAKRTRGDGANAAGSARSGGGAAKRPAADDFFEGMAAADGSSKRARRKPGAALLAQLDRSLKDASEDSLRACLGQIASSDEDLAERVLHVLEGLNAASSAGEDDEDDDGGEYGGGRGASGVRRARRRDDDDDSD